MEKRKACAGVYSLYPPPPAPYPGARSSRFPRSGKQIESQFDVLHPSVMNRGKAYAAGV